MRRPLVLVLPAAGDLGRDGALAAALLARAVAWGEAVGSVRRLERAPSAESVAESIGGFDGPLFLVAREQPRLTAFHADAALTDLAAGADLAVGPTLDDGRYLLALARLAPRGITPPPGLGDPAAGMERTRGLAAEAGLEAGLLRPERGLASAGDIRAARADPLFPRGIAALLPTP